MEQRVLQNIDRNGCQVMGVLEDDEGPGFCYSVGIQRQLGRPELVIFGLDLQIGKGLIKDYNQLLQNGQSFKVGVPYDQILKGVQVIFGEVEKRHYANYFSWNRWLYKGDDFKVLQMVWPSKSGHWPWDEDADEDFCWLQPRLFAGEGVPRPFRS